MTSFPQPILNYWHDLFAGDAVVAGGEASCIAVNSALDGKRRAMILEHAGGSIVAVLTPALADRIGVDRTRRMSIAALRERLAALGVRLHDPDYLFYLPETPKQGGAASPAANCRQLTPADREAFETFQAEASEQDLEDAYVELDHWAAFGSFEGDRLVSAASMYPWDNQRIADVGVLTLPAFRARGHARSVLQAINSFARCQGYEPQYRCQTDNDASVALARAAGLMLFGRWEVASAEAPSR